MTFVQQELGPDAENAIVKSVDYGAIEINDAAESGETIPVENQTVMRTIR